MTSESFKESFDQDGYAVAPQLFGPDEASSYRDHFTDLRLRGTYPHDMVGADPEARDPLRCYPRMAHMHRWDELSLGWLLDQRIARMLRMLLPADPYAVQTMLYFKPPGARGQAMHQDNFFLQAEPGTCIAAWMALDPADEDNGCLQIVPGSQHWPVLCAAPADTAASFTDVTVSLPPETRVRAIAMQPGDVLFFNGSLVHGSQPNRTADRFRRSLIGHYVQAEARQVAAYYHPGLTLAGAPVALGTSSDGGPCGEWADHDGSAVIEITGHRQPGQASE